MGNENKFMKSLSPKLDIMLTSLLVEPEFNVIYNTDI